MSPSGNDTAARLRVAAVPRRGGQLATILIFAFLIASAIIAFLVSAPRLLRSLAGVFPDNYEVRADLEVRRGNRPEAIRLVQRRVQRRSFDIGAQRLLARLIADGGDPEKGADAIREGMRRADSAIGRKISVTGYDEGRLLADLAEYWWRAQRFQASGEMMRMGLDAGAAELSDEIRRRAEGAIADAAAAEALADAAIKLTDRQTFERAVAAMNHPENVTSTSLRGLVLRAEWAEQVERSTTSALLILASAVGANPDAFTAPETTAAASQARIDPGTQSAWLALAASSRRRNRLNEARAIEEAISRSSGTKRIDLGMFARPAGSDGSQSELGFPRNGEAAARLETGAFRVTNLLVEISGQAALGRAPLLIISSGKDELTRLYIDGAQPRVYDLRLFPNGAPKNIDLRLRFINDAFDPVTRADRGVIIHALYWH